MAKQSYIHRPQIERTPLLYIAAGFAGGLIIARNSAPMSNPSKGAIFLAMLVGGYILWRAGYKGKRDAVASAVAVATATAVASAQATSQAVAHQAVQIILSGDPRGIHAVPALETAYYEQVAANTDGEYDEDALMETFTEVPMQRAKEVARRRR